MEAIRRNPAPRGRAARPFAPTPFRAAWWLPGAHAQTVAGRYLRPRTGVEYRRERIDTPDGDFVDLDWATVPRRPPPPEDAPLSILHLARLIDEAGVPAGVVNVVPGLGEVTGDALVGHPDVDKISFTGSPRVGKLIAKKAADTDAVDAKREGGLRADDAPALLGHSGEVDHRVVQVEDDDGRRPTHESHLDQDDIRHDT